MSQPTPTSPRRLARVLSSTGGRMISPRSGRSSSGNHTERVMSPQCAQFIEAFQRMKRKDPSITELQCVFPASSRSISEEVNFSVIPLYFVKLTLID